MTALTTPALPELVIVSCPAGCEQGHVIQYAGTEFESYPRCETCNGTSEVLVCSGCHTAVDPVTDACLCSRLEHPEVEWALSVGLCTLEQVA